MGCERVHISGTYTRNTWPHYRLVWTQREADFLSLCLIQKCKVLKSVILGTTCISGVQNNLMTCLKYNKNNKQGGSNQNSFKQPEDSFTKCLVDSFFNCRALLVTQSLLFREGIPENWSCPRNGCPFSGTRKGPAVLPLDQWLSLCHHLLLLQAIWKGILSNASTIEDSTDFFKSGASSMDVVR